MLFLQGQYKATHRLHYACTVVMLKYTGEYGKYCDVWQSAVTVIRSRDVTLKSCLQWLTRSYVIGDGVGRGYTSGAEIKDDLPACNNDMPLVEPC